MSSYAVNILGIVKYVIPALRKDGALKTKSRKAGFHKKIAWKN